MVQLRGMQNRVARLGRQAQSPFERRVPWHEFHHMMLNAVSKGEIDAREAEDIYFGVKHWYDNPDCWR